MMNDRIETNPLLRETLQYSTTHISVLLLFGMIAVIVMVLGFQHIGGYVPCQLCLEQRISYYFAIPIVFLSLISCLSNWPLEFARGLLALAFVAMCITIYQGAYHSGVEWSWWQGPSECSASIGDTSSDALNLLSDLANTKPPSCNEAADRFLGLSFAGWNVVVALGLAALAFNGAFNRKVGGNSLKN